MSWKYEAGHEIARLRTLARTFADAVNTGEVMGTPDEIQELTALIAAYQTHLPDVSWDVIRARTDHARLAYAKEGIVIKKEDTPLVRERRAYLDKLAESYR